MSRKKVKKITDLRSESISNLKSKLNMIDTSVKKGYCIYVSNVHSAYLTNIDSISKSSQSLKTEYSYYVYIRKGGRGWSSRIAALVALKMSDIRSYSFPCRLEEHSGVTNQSTVVMSIEDVLRLPDSVLPINFEIL